MRAEHTGKALPAVERDPRELPAVIVQEPRREAHAAAGGNIRERRVVIGAVEVVDLPGGDQAVLHGLQRRRRPAADHQRAPVEIFLRDTVFLSERIVPLRDQINAAFKQVMDADVLNNIFQCKIN